MTKSFRIMIACLLLLFSSSQLSFSQTMSFGDAIGGWAKICGKDVDTFCKGVKPGSDRLALCLAGKASSNCQAATGAFRANMANRFDAQEKAPRICRNDASRLCANFKSGRARVLRCIMQKENFRVASRRCKSALQAAGWLDTISK